MMNHERKYKKKFFKQKQTIGIWATLGAPCLAEIIANVGFDWILFDCEHGTNGPLNLIDQLNAVKSRNREIACLVRVGSNDIVEIKRVLDVGVDGIMIPMISSRADAEAAVKYCSYPPDGLRGVSGICRASDYGLREEYLIQASNEINILAQVENLDGLKNLEEIIDTKGIDGIFIGPSDLSASMGKLGSSSDKTVEDEIKKALQLIIRKNKPAGIIALSNDGGIQRFSQGFDFVAVAHDAHFISKELNSLKSQFSEYLKKI